MALHQTLTQYCPYRYEVVITTLAGFIRIPITYEEMEAFKPINKTFENWVKSSNQKIEGFEYY